MKNYKLLQKLDELPFLKMDHKNDFVAVFNIIDTPIYLTFYYSDIPDPDHYWEYVYPERNVELLTFADVLTVSSDSVRDNLLFNLDIFRRLQ